MKKFLSIIVFLLFSKFIFAQQTTILDSLNFYGSFRVQVAFFDDQVQVQNNASRAGIYLARKIMNGVSGFGGLELGTNLVSNNSSFNPDAATVPDETYTEPAEAVATTRLGFVGLQTLKFGSIAIGKQWSVYYDVTKWTDQFWTFGGLASGTYNTGNDGGGEGTGRAEDAVIYRYAAKRFSVGLQGQFNGSNNNYAASAVFKVSDELSVGAAWNTYDIPQDIHAIVGYSIDRANSFAAGANYTGKKFGGALVYSYNQSEVQYPGDTVVAFPGNGVELRCTYFFTPKLMAEAGGNLFIPTETPEVIDPDFEVFQIYLGGAYFFLPDFLAYVDYKIDVGTNTSGDKPNNAFVVGLRYNFSFGRSQIKM